MARNPYAELGTASDPYTNGRSTPNTNPYAGSPSASPAPAARASPGNRVSDYDPYGDRYGSPPVAAPAPARERREGIRQGSHGAVYEQSNGSRERPQLRERSSERSGYGSARSAVPPGLYESSITPPDRSPRRVMDGTGSGGGGGTGSGSGSGSVGRANGNGRLYRQERSGGSRGSDGLREMRMGSGSGMGSGMDFRRRQPEPDRLGYGENGYAYANGNGNEFAAGRARGGIMGRVPSTGGGDGTRQIEEVLEALHTDWSFMAQDKCVPVQVALQFMDSSSLGRAHQYDQFQEMHRQLQRALKAIVNEHHQGFNSSIGTFHKIQSSIQASQTRLRNLKDSLTQAKTGLVTTKPELKVMATTSRNYDEMIQTLTHIEQLRLVTDKLEARISEKRFLSAIDILQDGLRMVRRPGMGGIGALSDLRTYLTNQETSLTDILIEELHSHLYLKSPYCQDRWKAHAKEQSNGASVDGTDVNISSAQPLWQYLESCDFSNPIVEDPMQNPETDSFSYIRLLVESLNKLGRLDVAVTAIEQRLPVELYGLVEKTNNDVDQRHPSSLRRVPRSSEHKIDIGIDGSDVQAIIVYDLLWCLYAKFEAIAEGHRVLHDVAAGIAVRERLPDGEALTTSFKELWLLYQNEIRSLLHDYLATDSNIYRMNQTVEPNADQYKRGQRKKDKQIFALSDMDSKSVEMSTELEDLESILKNSVPGLVSSTKSLHDTVSSEKASVKDGTATGHKLLVEASVFNMGLLLPPSLTFLHRLKDIVPPRPDLQTSTLTSFLDDFLVNVFLPQLDETLVKVTSQVFAETDAFREDPSWQSVAARPIFRGTSAFFNLIVAFCRMLDTIPHDQAFSQLIISQMVSYYDKCCDWYKGLVSKTQDTNADESSLKTSAALAAGPGEIHDTMKKLWIEGRQDRQMLETETGLLILQTNESPLRPADTIQDRKVIDSLCMLYTSMKWLSSKVEHLRHLTSHDTDSSRRRSAQVRAHGRRWTLLNETSRAVQMKRSVYLPMTQETIVAFDSIVSSFQNLSITILLTIHTELRTQIILSLTASLSPLHTPYLLNQTVNDPDPSILALNTSLMAYDESASVHLLAKELTFIRTGLGLLMDTLLVTNAGSVKAMNANGCGRMQLNILVLQQNLKNVENSSNLSRATAYYDLFMAGPDAIVDLAKIEKEREHGVTGNGRVQDADRSNGATTPTSLSLGKGRYTYDELKTLLELCYSEQMADPERGVSTVARRSMGDRLLTLSEVMWES